MQKLPSETVPGLSPCWSHFIYVAQARDVPLDPKDVKPPLARWKLFRWLKWAIQQGIIDPVEYFVPIRSLRVVSPLKRFDESIVNKYARTNDEEIDGKRDPAPASEKSEKRKGRDKSKESKKGSSKRSPDEVEEAVKNLPDVSFWADFNKMEPHIRDVHFFYKLDYFEYTAKVSDRFKSKGHGDQKSESKKDSKKGSRGTSPVRVTSGQEKFVDVHYWPREMLRSRNEPLYIFVDSVEEKFFLINFSTFQVPDVSQTPVPGSEHTDITIQSSAGQLSDPLKVSSFAQSVASRDCLIIERHSWFHRQKYGNDLVHLPTSGTKATVLELKSGRHLLRVYCGSETNCFTTISSDTIFHLGDRRRMYELMCTESDTIDLKVKHISNCVSNAYQTFGTDEHPGAMKLYYKSYMPPGPILKKRTKTFYHYIHLCFLCEEVRLIRDLVPQDQVQGIVRALRIFFLNPLIGLPYFNPFAQALKAIRDTSTPRTSVEKTKLFMEIAMGNNVLDKNYAASVIQSFFKMLLIRKYKRIHNPMHEEHQSVLENLLKVVELFNYNKRESIASNLFRYILQHFDRLRDIYPCSKDFEYTIQAQELTGTLKMLKPEQWTPIARLLVNARTAETVFANIDLFVNLPRYCVRVFNNDTKQEMLRVVNNVVPTRYEHVKLGYTVFAYGWNGDQPAKEVTWTMLMITKKAQPVFYSMDQLGTPSASLLAPLLVTEELSNHYVPSNRKIIAKWTIRISKPTMVSFRLCASYEKVKIQLRVTNSEDDLLSEISGTSRVILPLVYLGQSFDSSVTKLKVDAKPDSIEQVEVNGSRASGETLSQQIYYVEAFVLDDSWPLTKSEWAVVTEVKSKRAGSTVRSKISVFGLGRLLKSESSKIRRASKASGDSIHALEKPYWVLQVVTDHDSGSEIAEDKSKEEKITKMKETWSKTNPDSLARGKKIREEFRAKHEIKPEPSELSTRELFVKECCPDVAPSQLEIRTLEPPQSLRKLPKLSLSAYKIKEDEEDTPWVKTVYDEETLRNARLANIIYAQEDYNCSIEELSGLMKNRKDRYRMLFGEHYDSFSGRRTLVENVYEERKSYLPSKKDSSPKGSKKSAKTKSSKSKKV
ncbi:androglobin [Halictus rubicundus]|uniref:androglobin n=1 Tax=Halictus rubicundus TaxID=77578 RepID=UPI004035B4CC